MPVPFQTQVAIANLQSSLTTLGHACGAIDGLPGPKLAAALDGYRATLRTAKPETHAAANSDPWPNDNEVELIAFFGHRGSGAHMTTLTLPEPMHLYEPGGPLIRELWVNKRIATPLYNALSEVAALPADMIHDYELDVTAGCYNPRTKTGSSHSWSLHAYGAAFDISPRQNPYGKKGTLPQEVVDAFRKQGAQWGGIWKTPDPHHFQWAKS